MKIKKLLVAIDNSEYAHKAAMKAFEMAGSYNAEIGIVFVLETIQNVTSAELGFLSADIMKKAKDEASEIIDQLIDKAKIKAEKFLPEGNPADCIIKIAEEFGADMICLSTHGRTGLMHLLLGSVAESVVQQSKIPVLIYPAKCL